MDGSHQDSRLDLKTQIMIQSSVKDKSGYMETESEKKKIT